MDLFLYGLQQRHINRTMQEAARAEHKGQQAQSQVRMLEQRVDRLSLACQALWELLRERMDLDDAVMVAKMEEIDLRDGAADGKMGSTVIQCPNCTRKVNSSRKTCLYCATDISAEKPHVFE